MSNCYSDDWKEEDGLLRTPSENLEYVQVDVLEILCFM